ncbi:hypothetical protein NCCP2716_13480 [Sporosarcina sp. NCCP-2716]|uniref:polysaccharide deacetylase family protein n=1 Tax=Sporosarcina sp. NCCP-2716 TaxID=2943679 RepID=UPI00203F4ABA|nr:polysaccharide deacetylase family protein [Sporosarcina sp. NCCP-2716]GKV68850.1 hypothetical protein NCCP2716_13480 [Sporosarcina sp. NCCP-2716]
MQLSTEKKRRRKLKKPYAALLILLLIAGTFFAANVNSAKPSPAGVAVEKTGGQQESAIQEQPDTKKPSSADAPIEVEDRDEGAPEETGEREGNQKDGTNEATVDTTGQTPRKTVYLTFDDGPSRWTDEIVEVLHTYDVKATFFMQGVNLQKPQLQDSVRRAAEAGHYIGAHSMTHNYRKLYTDQKFVPEMMATLQLIRQLTGTEPHLVRPPYGSAPGLKDSAIRSQIADEGLKVWDWTIDSHDWELRDNPAQIKRNIVNQLKNDTEVILMHEKQQTLDELPEIIQYLKQQGYSFAVYEDSHHFSVNFMNDPDL